MDLTNKGAQQNLICKNCGKEFIANYCNNCGQKLINERNTLKHLFQLFMNSMDMNRGFIYTAKLLLLNPKKIINEYLGGRTKAFINPLKYLFIIVGISTILTIWSKVFDTSFTATNELLDVSAESLRFQEKVMIFMKKYLNIFTILFIPFYSIISKWLLKKQKLHYAEHLIINSYLYAQYALLNLLPFIIILLFPEMVQYVFYVSVLIFTIYYSYALKQIFSISVIGATIKAILINILGIFLITFVSMVLTILFILLMKLGGANLEQLFG